IYARAYDGHAYSNIAEINITIFNNHAPVITNMIPSDGVVDVNVTLSWNSYDEDGDSMKYDIYLSSSYPLTKIASNITETYFDIHCQYSTTYYWKVIAWDEHGGRGESEIKNFTTIPKPNSPPSCIITEPGNGATVNGTIVVMGIATDEDGNDTITKVEIKIDNGAWNNATGTNEWSYTIDTTSLSNGEHTIYARAYDGHAYSNIAEINIHVANGAEAREHENSILIYVFIILAIVVALLAVLKFKKFI
ncbi:MAG: hypothetical protein J7J52_04235, partial [Deltaproteobacteria bacterium]|nr:hypothetical protein [Deltaproteobacteria bacterium]